MRDFWRGFRIGWTRANGHPAARVVASVALLILALHRTDVLSVAFAFFAGIYIGLTLGDRGRE